MMPNAQTVYMIESNSICSDILCLISTIIVCGTSIYLAVLHAEMMYSGEFARVHSLRALRGV